MTQLVEIFDLIDSLTADNAVLANQLDAGEHNAADVSQKVMVLIDANFPNIRKPSEENLKDAVMFSAKEVKDLGIMVLGNYAKETDEAERLDIMSSLYALMLQLDTSTTQPQGGSYAVSC